MLYIVMLYCDVLCIIMYITIYNIIDVYTHVYIYRHIHSLFLASSYVILTMHHDIKIQYFFHFMIIEYNNFKITF